MPGTYHKMSEDNDRDGHRRHKHRHHSHHKHRHGGHGQHHGSTDTSLEIPQHQRNNYDVESTYKDSLYNPKDSLYGGGVKDSLYSGDDGGHHQHHQRGGYHSGSDTRLTSPARISPRHSDREQRHAENTFDHVTRTRETRGRSSGDRIWQDPVARGAESGQIRSSTDIQNIYLPSTDLAKSAASPVRKPDLRGYIEPGRPGSGLAAAAALVRGDTYTPEKITTGGKVKVAPPVPQKPRQPHNKVTGMEELWPGGWEEYSEYHYYPNSDRSPSSSGFTYQLCTKNIFKKILVILSERIGKKC